MKPQNLTWEKLTADGGAEIQRPVQTAIIIKPPSGNHMALQRPAKQNIPIV